MNLWWTKNANVVILIFIDIEVLELMHKVLLMIVQYQNPGRPYAYYKLAPYRLTPHYGTEMVSEMAVILHGF